MRRRVQASSFLGALIEWYDFYIYGFAAAIVLNTLFFPKLDSTAGIIASFATLAIGYIARPLGALIFSHYGDRVGRKGVLVITLLVMGLSSTLVGCLPTYASIGIWAPILLVLLRILQGISAGGEFGGAVLMTVEHAEPGRRGIASSVAQLGLYGGLLLANGVYFLASLLPKDQFLTWGWRLPFLGSILLIGIALWIRLGISESPVFTEAKQEAVLSKTPVADLFRYQWRPLLIVVMLFFGIATFSAFQATFITSYATQLGFSTSAALAMTLTGTALAVLVLPLSASASDRFGRKKIVTIGGLTMFVTGSLVLAALGTKSLGIAIPAVAALWLSHSIAYGPIAVWMSELFPTGSRYGGVSVGYQVSATLGAGFFPLIGASLLAAGGGIEHYGWVLGYVFAAVLITLAGARLARETAHDGFVQLDRQAVQDPKLRGNRSS